MVTFARYYRQRFHYDSVLDMKNKIKVPYLLLLSIILLVASNFIVKTSFDTPISKKQTNRSKSDTAITLHDGDIIFQSSYSGQSKAIQLATHSKFSHCGILFREGDQWYVYEAIQPVKKTRFEKWITHGDNNAYKVMRLKNADQILTGLVLTKLKNETTKHLGKDYDLTFEWSDTRIYCSELVWKAFKNSTQLDIGNLQQLKEFDLSHPVVKQKLSERYGTKIPLEEPVISPGNIAASQLLYTVVDTF